MKNKTNKLVLIKLTHTLVWIVMVLVIFYSSYAGITDKLDIYLWIALSTIILEIIVLALNKWECPLTTIAKKYLNKKWEMGDDIYLPIFLDKYNREIFTPIIIIGILIITF